MLIIFPSHLKHGVPSQLSNSQRIVISGNINAMSGLTVTDDETLNRGVSEMSVVCN